MSPSRKHNALDEIDRQILRELLKNSKATYFEIGKTVGLSAPSVNERVKKLAAEGIIRQYTVLLDEKKLGPSISAFVNVFLTNPKHTNDFLRAVRELREVAECHHVTGEFTYVLKVKTRDTESLEQLITEKIRSIEGVSHTLTNVILSSIKEEHQVSTELLD